MSIPTNILEVMEKKGEAWRLSYFKRPDVDILSPSTRAIAREAFLAGAEAMHDRGTITLDFDLKRQLTPGSMTALRALIQDEMEEYGKNREKVRDLETLVSELQQDIYSLVKLKSSVVDKYSVLTLKYSDLVDKYVKLKHPDLES